MYISWFLPAFYRQTTTCYSRLHQIRNCSVFCLFVFLHIMTIVRKLIWWKRLSLTWYDPHILGTKQTILPCITENLPCLRLIEVSPNYSPVKSLRKAKRLLKECNVCEKDKWQHLFMTWFYQSERYWKLLY